MDLKTKIAYAGKSIESIARHDDVDAAVREAALDEVVKKIDAERQAIAERLQAKIGAFSTDTPATTH